MKSERVLGRKAKLGELIKFAYGIVHDYIKYGSTISDYFELGFYNKSEDEKATYLTNRLSDKVAFSLDSSDEIIRHHSKQYEYEELKQFFGREQLFLPQANYDDFCAFVSKHPVFLFKPDTSDCGEGIQKIIVDDKNKEEVYNRLHAAHAVLDEPLRQHAELSRLCPGSVNTIRVISAKVKDEVYILAAALRIGSGTSLVDNYTAGGMVAAIDINNGVLIDSAEDHTGNRYPEHPYTHVMFKGFQIPNWDKVLNLVKDAALQYDLHYIGWDVAVRENDCVLVEANPRPMIHVFQIAGATGKRKEYEDIYNLWKQTVK